MASIRREVRLRVAPGIVWEAVRAVGEVHTRLARGFVTATVLEGDTRTVTFANGMVVREQIVTVDDDRRRLVYSAIGGRASHHNAAFEVCASDDGQTLLVWVTDLLPDSVSAPVARMMDLGLESIRATLEATE